MSLINFIISIIIIYFDFDENVALFIATGGQKCSGFLLTVVNIKSSVILCSQNIQSN